jgi:translation initiation factor IF-2
MEADIYRGDFVEDMGESFDSSDDNKLIEVDVAELVSLELGHDVDRERTASEIDAAMIEKAFKKSTSVVPRAPVVCIMGHVDHGKTTLLDTLRTANVAASEAGGITQRLSAFVVSMGGKRTVFLDTPGHAAFTAMRSYGAAATDLVILVVAIDDGVRPQTIEALKIAKQSKSLIIIALNKVDKIATKEELSIARRRVLNELVEYDLISEDFGGEVQVVEVSGKSGLGISDLIEKVQLEADVQELNAAEAGPAEGTLLDVVVEKGRGVVVDLLVQWGALSVGDIVVAGTSYGKIRAMYDDAGKSISGKLSFNQYFTYRLVKIFLFSNFSRKTIDSGANSWSSHSTEGRGRAHCRRV